MIEVVRRSREHYLTGLATNNFLTARPSMPGDNLSTVLDLFDEVMESSRLGIRKPEPAFFERCCTQLAIRPSEAVFIDDLGINLKPARLLGMTTVKFVTEDQAIDDLESALRIALR
jgi:putative hydrolase of the HAD superfamily